MLEVDAASRSNQRRSSSRYSWACRHPGPSRPAVRRCDGLTQLGQPLFQRAQLLGLAVRGERHPPLRPAVANYAREPPRRPVGATRQTQHRDRDDRISPSNPSRGATLRLVARTRVGGLPWNHTTARRVPPFAAAPSAHAAQGTVGQGPPGPAQKHRRPFVRPCPRRREAWDTAGLESTVPKKQRPVAGATGCGMHRQGRPGVGRRCARGFDRDLWALSQLVAAAGQVGGLGGVARQLDGFVVGRA